MSAKLSMEEFAGQTGRNVSLRDYIKRRVLAVVFSEETDGVWEIKLTLDAKIINYDPLIPMPAYVVGYNFDQWILGAKQNGKPVTELRFGLQQVFLNPLEYAMQDPVVTRNQIVFAQRSLANT